LGKHVFANWNPAFGIHILTASGAACALLALMAAVEPSWSAMFSWLGVALIVDAVDGPLARRYSVATLLPRWSGETLDLVVDYLTYVFVPAFAIARSGLMPDPLGLIAAIAIVISSALYFADRKMKTHDNYFRGFPGLWNAAAFYLILLSPPPWAATLAVAVLVATTFAPFPFLHPLRVVEGRALNIAILVGWSVLAVIAIAQNMAPGFWITVALCIIAVYVVSVGFLRRNGASAG
jgi:phosphatidylcholine synthase